MKKGFTLIEMMIVVAIIAIIAAIAIPSLLAARRSSLETNAVGSCRTYATAQTMYKRNDWDGDGAMPYATPFTNLNLDVPSGRTINLIDGAFAAAVGAAGTPKHGYLFQDMVSIGGAANPINWAVDYGLCGIPAVYGRSGFRSFIVNTNGTVFGNDQGAATAFVTDYPAVLAPNWIIAE